MIYLRNKLNITWKLEDKPSETVIDNLNKYFERINKFKFIVIDFECDLKLAAFLIDKFPKVVGFTLFKTPMICNLGDEKDETYKTLTKTQLFKKWTTNEEIKNIELNDNFICTNNVDTVSICNNIFYYGNCERKEFVCDLEKDIPNVKTEPLICNDKTCNCKCTKTNISNIHIKKDVCLENPMFYIKWRLTNACNYHCSYCIRKDLGLEGFPGYYELIKRADKLNKIKIPFRLELIGGEVTIFDLVPLLSRITTKNLKAVYISTNLFREAGYFEYLYDYLYKRKIELSLSCSLHEEECDEDKFIEKVRYLSTVVDHIYLECVSTDKNKKTIEKILNIKKDNVKISLDYLRDRNDNILAEEKYNVINSKHDLIVNLEKEHHSNFSGFVSAGLKCKSNGLYIDVDGSIYRRSCKQKQLISDIYKYDFNIKEDIIDCPNSICNFSSNVEIYNK